MPADVYLHIGLPKTATTSLQGTLWRSREKLAAQGVLVPGATRTAQFNAVSDLMGRRPRGSDQPRIAGSWGALVDEVQAWSGTRAVISEEYLAFARPRQARRVVRAFAPGQVHLVVTLRDLARVVIGAWQQELAKGRGWTWEEYSGAVQDPESGPASAGLAFWLRQDVVRVLDRWEQVVPRERIHLVTVPPTGSPSGLLLERFAAATGLDPARLDRTTEPENLSVDAAGAEALRRLNLALEGRLNERQYTRVVANGVRRALQNERGSLRMGLPAHELPWVTDRSKAMIAQLRERDHHVVGDLEDLMPAPAEGAAPTPVRPDALADAALTALEAVSEQYARFWWRARVKDEPVPTTRTARLASSARAMAGRTRLMAFDVMDKSPIARRITHRFLDRAG